MAVPVGELLNYLPVISHITDKDVRRFDAGDVVRELKRCPPAELLITVRQSFPFHATSRNWIRILVPLWKTSGKYLKVLFTLGTPENRSDGSDRE